MDYNAQYQAYLNTAETALAQQADRCFNERSRVCEAARYSLFGGVGIRTEGHQEVIRSRAAAGWRYVGYLPSVQRASGHIETIELVFEREIEQE